MSDNDDITWRTESTSEPYTVHGDPIDVEHVDRALAAVDERRRDPAFMARLQRIMDENRSVLDALAPHDGGA